MKQEFIHHAALAFFASGETPFHPMGFCQHGESKYFLTGKHLGRRVGFDSLPDQVKTFILRSI